MKDDEIMKILKYTLTLLSSTIVPLQAMEEIKSPESLISPSSILSPTKRLSDPIQQEEINKYYTEKYLLPVIKDMDEPKNSKFYKDYETFKKAPYQITGYKKNMDWNVYWEKVWVPLAKIDRSLKKPKAYNLEGIRQEIENSCKEILVLNQIPVEILLLADFLKKEPEANPHNFKSPEPMAVSLPELKSTGNSFSIHTPKTINLPEILYENSTSPFENDLINKEAEGLLFKGMDSYSLPKSENEAAEEPVPVKMNLASEYKSQLEAQLEKEREEAELRMAQEKEEAKLRAEEEEDLLREKEEARIRYEEALARDEEEARIREAEELARAKEALLREEREKQEALIRTANMQKDTFIIESDLRYVQEYYKKNYPDSIFGKLSKEKEDQIIESATFLIKRGKILNNGEALKKAIELVETEKAEEKIEIIEEKISTPVPQQEVQEEIEIKFDEGASSNEKKSVLLDNYAYIHEKLVDQYNSLMQDYNKSLDDMAELKNYQHETETKLNNALQEIETLKAELAKSKESNR